VPLSEHEQRLLEQMERALYAEDPKFASSLRSAGPRPGLRRKAVIGVLAALAGLALLITGAATYASIGWAAIAVGVLGFVLMLGGTVLVIRGLRTEPVDPTAARTAAPTPTSSTPKQGFMDRLDERFRKRREGDGA
jgi:Protein of unknown function (DUF3040)